MTVPVLRPYQVAAVEGLRALLRKGRRRVLLVSPTGSGKTLCVSEVIRSAVAKGKRVLFVSHTREIINQTSAKLDSFEVPHGVIQADHWRKFPDLPVQVASIQTLVRREPPKADLLIVDEAHHARAGTYGKVLDRYPGAVVVGATASPWRGDGKGLGELFEDLVVASTPAKLIEQGYLVPFGGFSFEAPDLRGVRIARGDYEAPGLELACNKAKIVGGLVEHWKSNAGGVRTIVFAVGVAHSQAIVEKFRAAGVAAEHLDGTATNEQRDAILGRLASGQTRVVSNCSVLCLDDRTEILTDHGWVGIDGMTPRHLVANWRDRESTYFEEPLEIIRRDRAPGERMVSMTGERSSCRVSEGHGVLYRTLADGRFFKKPARELVGKQVRIPACGVSRPLSVAPEQPPVMSNRRRNRLIAALSYSIRKREGGSWEYSRAEAARRVSRKAGLVRKTPAEVSADECRLIGFWLGDRSACRLDSGGIEYTLSQSMANPVIVNWVDCLLGRLNFSVCRKMVPPPKKNPKTKNWSVRWSLCRGTGGGSQEREGLFPIEPYLSKDGTDLFWGFNQAQFDALVEGFWLSDGNHGNTAMRATLRTAFSIYNTNKRLLDTLQAVASVRGYKTTLTLGCNHIRNPKHSKIWTLRLVKREVFSIGNDRFKFENEWKDERLWCVRTSSGNIVTRRDGRVLVLGNCEGVDVPAATCVILARPTRSPSLYLQMVGRVLRPFEGKPRALIHDHAGLLVQFGCPDEERDYSLTSDVSIQDRAKPPRIVQCPPPCGRVYPLVLPACPECGRPNTKPAELRDAAEREVEEIAATRMVAIEEIRRLRAVSQKTKASEYKRLQALALARGYHWKWAWHRFVATFSEEPRFPREVLDSVVASTHPVLDLRRLRAVEAKLREANERKART